MQFAECEASRRSPVPPAAIPGNPAPRRSNASSSVLRGCRRHTGKVRSAFTRCRSSSSDTTSRQCRHYRIPRRASTGPLGVRCSVRTTHERSMMTAGDPMDGRRFPILLKERKGATSANGVHQTARRSRLESFSVRDHRRDAVTRLHNLHPRLAFPRRERPAFSAMAACTSHNGCGTGSPR